MKWAKRVAAKDTACRGKEIFLRNNQFLEHHLIVSHV